MKIIVIGSKGAGKGAHFSEGIVKAFRQMNHDVSFYDPLDFATEKEKLQRQWIPLSIFERSYNDKYDFMFIDQCNFEFKNDIDNLVFYNHKYLHRHPRVFYPDVMFHACEPFKDFFIRQEHQRYCHYVPKHEILYPAVDPDLYKPIEKDLKGIIGIGFRRSFDSWVKAGGISMGPTNDIIKREVEQFKTFEYYYDTPITDDEYKDLLSRAEAIWVPVPPYQYITRRMLEAMACKTLSVFKIESDQHRKVLEQMGYIFSEDYVGFYDIYEIEDFSNDLTFNRINLPLSEIIASAYEKTMKNHTYTQRAEQILKIYEELK